MTEAMLEIERRVQRHRMDHPGVISDLELCLNALKEAEARLAAFSAEPLIPDRIPLNKLAEQYGLGHLVKDEYRSVTVEEQSLAATQRHVDTMQEQLRHPGLTYDYGFTKEEPAAPNITLEASVKKAVSAPRITDRPWR